MSGGDERWEMAGTVVLGWFELAGRRTEKKIFPYFAFHRVLPLNNNTFQELGEM